MVGAIEACKARGGKIIAQANAKMPYTFGDSEYDVEDFDAIYEVDLPIASNARRPKVEAATGDAAAVKAQFGKLGETCKACHDKYRKEEH